MVISVVVDCNRCTDGCFRGKISTIVLEWKNRRRHYADPILGREVKFNYDPKGEFFSIGRHHFRYERNRTWPGSWGCEEFFITKEEAKKLLEYIKLKN